MIEEKESYIYFIGSTDNNVVKIGVAKEPAKRLSAIQTGCPFKLEIFASVLVSEFDPYVIEKDIHKALSFYSLSGEWFKLTGMVRFLIRTISGYSGLYFTISNRFTKVKNWTFATYDYDNDREVHISTLKTVIKKYKPKDEHVINGLNMIIDDLIKELSNCYGVINAMHGMAESIQELSQGKVKALASQMKFRDRTTNLIPDDMIIEDEENAWYIAKSYINSTYHRD